MDRLYNKATSSHNITRIIGEKKSPGRVNNDTIGGDYMAPSMVNGKIRRPSKINESFSKQMSPTRSPDAIKKETHHN